MAQIKFTSVDDYMAMQPEAAKGPLERVRTTIRRAIPGAEETISYQIPAYKLGKTTVVYFAGWKEHYSLYPVGERLLAALGVDAAGYEVNKGTIRFPLARPVPVKLIGQIARFRAKEIAEREKAKSARP